MNWLTPTSRHAGFNPVSSLVVGACKSGGKLTTAFGAIGIGSWTPDQARCGGCCLDHSSLMVLQTSLSTIILKMSTFYENRPLRD